MNALTVGTPESLGNGMTMYKLGQEGGHSSYLAVKNVIVVNGLILEKLGLGQ